MRATAVLAGMIVGALSVAILLGAVVAPAEAGDGCPPSGDWHREAVGLDGDDRDGDGYLCHRAIEGDYIVGAPYFVNHGGQYVHTDNSVPGTECAPPVIGGITPTSVEEPEGPGLVNSGVFRVRGSNFSDAQIYTDGPLLLVGDTTVNAAGKQAARAYEIGWGAPEPGTRFNISVVNGCGSDSISVAVE